MAESRIPLASAGDEEIKPLMVQVTAPASLPAGYTFEALINDDPDKPFTCEVVRYDSGSLNPAVEALFLSVITFSLYVLYFFPFYSLRVGYRKVKPSWRHSQLE